KKIRSNIINDINHNNKGISVITHIGGYPGINPALIIPCRFTILRKNRIFTENRYYILVTIIFNYDTVRLWLVEIIELLKLPKINFTKLLFPNLIYYGVPN